MRYSGPSIAGARFFDKSKEVGDDSLTWDGVSGYGNKLQRNDHLASRRETSKSETALFRFLSKPKSANFIIEEGVTTSYKNNGVSPSSTTEKLFPSASANSGLERKEVLSEKKNFEQQQLQTGASMVDKSIGGT